MRKVATNKQIIYIILSTATAKHYTNNFTPAFRVSKTSSDETKSKNLCSTRSETKLWKNNWEHEYTNLHNTKKLSIYKVTYHVCFINNKYLYEIFEYMDCL